MIDSKTDLTPAAKEYVACQLSWCRELTENMFKLMSQVTELNLQHVQQSVDATITGSQQVLNSSNGNGASLTPLVNAIQPSAENARAYQQSLQQIIAESGLHLAKTAEALTPETLKAAQGWAEEAQSKANEARQQSQSRRNEVTNNSRSTVTKTFTPTNTQQSNSQSTANKPAMS